MNEPNDPAPAEPSSVKQSPADVERMLRDFSPPTGVAPLFKAGDWVRETAKIAGGGGGGRPQMAQAGGKDAAKLADALERAREFVRQAIK